MPRISRNHWKAVHRGQEQGSNLLLKAAPGAGKRLGITKAFMAHNDPDGAILELHWGSGTSDPDKSAIKTAIAYGYPATFEFGEVTSNEGPDNVGLYLTDVALNTLGTTRLHVYVFGYTEEEV